MQLHHRPTDDVLPAQVPTFRGPSLLGFGVHQLLFLIVLWAGPGPVPHIEMQIQLAVRISYGARAGGTGGRLLRLVNKTPQNDNDTHHQPKSDFGDWPGSECSTLAQPFLFPMHFRNATVKAIFGPWPQFVYFLLGGCNGCPVRVRLQAFPLFPLIFPRDNHPPQTLGRGWAGLHFPFSFTHRLKFL